MLEIEGFNVRMVFAGDMYGRGDVLKHSDSRPLVEFYDAHPTRGNFPPRGQFVSRYYAKMVLEIPKGAGLNLEGGVPQWTVSGDAIDVVRDYVRQEIEQRQTGEVGVLAAPEHLDSSGGGNRLDRPRG